MSIKIKKSHEGLFTAKAEAAGQSDAAYARYVMANKEHFRPETVKQANFALNARKWKHK